MMNTTTRKTYTRVEKNILCFLFACILVFCTPIKIEKELSAIEIKINDPTYLKDRQVLISGTYHINLFRGHSFRGQITLPDYMHTREKMNTLLLDRQHGDVLSFTYTIYGGRTEFRKYVLGYLYASFLLKDFAIAVGDEQADNPAALLDGASWSSDTGTCIVPNAATWQEAMGILLKLGLLPDDEQMRATISGGG